LSSGYLGPLSPQQTSVLKRAERSNRNILEMIETLLDVERLEVGALALKWREIQMVPWLRVSLSDWEIVAAGRDVSIHIAIPDELPPVHGDMALLQRLLDNLISNALNFTPEAECVEVAAWAEEACLVIRVADHGPGVPECERERIFHKFAQVEGGQRRGSGLGLTFCRMVAEAHQGSIEVSDNPSGGAIFSLRLPLTPHAEAEGIRCANGRSLI
jgi:two-component system, OmpR family, sensor histidine kinase KdpD